MVDEMIAQELTFNGSSEQFSTLAEFEEQLKSAVESGNLEPFWNAVVATGQMPLIFGDRLAVFLYRGRGGSVNWKGGFTIPYERQGQTDLWVLRREFEPDARLDYRIEIDGWDTFLDPLNPLVQPGGFGVNSAMRMPGYVFPEFSLPRQDIQHGALSPNRWFWSGNLGYDVNYRVYTPAGYEQKKHLPVLYAVDGQDYANPDFGAMVNTLDNLIADKKIRPIMAVFINPSDPITGENRRWREMVSDSPEECRFCKYLTEELVPKIDAEFKTDATPGGRAIIGFSLGGHFTSKIGLLYSDVFHLIGIQAPYFLGHEWIPEQYERAERLPIKVFLSHGVYDAGADSLRLRDLLLKKDYPVLYVETHDGHSWGNIRGVLDQLLIYFFGS